MAPAAFLTATPLGCPSLPKPRSVCEQSMRRSLLVARATIDRPGTRGPAYMDETNENDDGGDGFFGDPGDLNQSLGIPMPRMNPSEFEYFSNARNEEDRMNRLREIAKKRHNDTLRAQMEAKLSAGDVPRSNTSGSYLDRLARISRVNETRRLEEMGLVPPGSTSECDEGAEPPRRVETVDFLEARRRGMNAGERYMDELQRGHSTPAPPPVEKPVQSSSPVNGEALASKSDAFVPSETDSSALDKQIAFLEEHLSKLQAEEAKESVRPEPNKSNTMNMSSQIKDLTKKMGGPSIPPTGRLGDLSAEETRAVFEQIRAAQQEARGRLPIDSLATPLEQRRQSGELDFDDVALNEGPALMSDDELKAKFEEVRRHNRESLSPPARAKAAREMDPLKSALRALRAEHQKYIDASRRTLDVYERNLDNIVSKHIPDMD